MKRILCNFWTQLFFGIVAGIIGIIISYLMAFVFYFKYAGFSFFDIGSSGDDSPVTFAFASCFTILTISFPTLIWFFLKKFGSFGLIVGWTKVMTFILFATLPLSTYLGMLAFSKLQTEYANYRSVRDDCLIQNGVNKKTIGDTTDEIECKNGIYDGFFRTYNSPGITIYEGNFSNGKKNGTEIVYYDNGKVRLKKTFRNGNQEGAEVFYNEDGSTSLYLTNDKEKSGQVYYQIPEKNLDGDRIVASQQFYCDHQGDSSLRNYSYICLNNILNGEFIKYDSKGNVLLKMNITNSRLDGIYEQFIDGKLYRHLEFKEGWLEGKVQAYSVEGILEYEGQYTNGLQDGVFRVTDYRGNFVSIVFDHGQVVRINK